MASDRDRDQRAINLLMERGVLGKNVTLHELARVSVELAALGDDGSLAAWVFISPNFIYKGDDPVNKKKVTTRGGR